MFLYYFFHSHARHLYLHSFPTRRSSDLRFFLYSGHERPALHGLRDFISGEIEQSGSDIQQAGAFIFSAQRTVLRGQNKHSVLDRKSTRLNSSHTVISYAVFCLKKKKTKK